MRKRITLPLLAGLLAAVPATAQDKASFNIYGTLIAYGENVEATGATRATAYNNSMVTIAPTATNVPARFRFTCSTSNIGFKGDYKVDGDNFKVIWQLESSASVDGDQPSVLAGRNSCIGIAGKTWGTLFVGSWDTPYKVPQIFTGALRGLFPFDFSLTGNPGFNVPGTVTNSGRAGTKNDASFNRRQGNSLQYWSPDWSGFSFRLAYSANESKPTTDAATTLQYNPTVISALLTYKIGGLTLNYGYEQHNDYFGLSQLTGNATAPSLTNTGSKDEGHEFLAFYVIKETGTRITAMVEQLKYHNDETVIGKVNEYKRTAWAASVQQTFGQHKIWGVYSNAADGSATVLGTANTSTSNLGASQVSLGYAYSVAKTADVFATFYQITNKEAATYGAFPVLSGINPGADTKGFGVGILYTF
ncbi:porin [Mesoterricola sediminis]|uniref:Porin domain-containing protein n=1 Tax=Mesoterricola sediminis TaxID=2927980 RepID=A0AA48GPR7_9BACT|nr:porin [Mesoterricola sediminis]BDU77006.1 hypothetical protein METESE_19640 [Mesoterricola sediminis]